VGWAPLGGYVRFAGDDNAASVPDQDDLGALRGRIVAREGVGAERRYFFFKPLWQRALIVAAGPVINFIFSIAIFATLFATVGEPADTMNVRTVSPGSAAAAAGLAPGDHILGVDGQRLSTFEQLRSYVRGKPGVPMTLAIDRAGRSFILKLTPNVVTQPNKAGGLLRFGQLGVTDDPYHRYAPVEAIGRGAVMTWTIVDQTGYYVGRMIDGKSGWPFQGFLGAAQATGSLGKETISTAEAEHGNLFSALAIQYLALAAILSTSIGLVNLLPIPVLDGGHLLFYAYEAVVRRPLPAMAQAAGYRAGLALLVGLMLFTAWHDLQRMQVFHYLGTLFS
jgi:regulator of sigma E protease